MLPTLDKDRLDDLIKALQSARQFGFESLSSPVDVLLDGAIDVMLLLKTSLIEGKRGAKLTPGLKFSDKEQDSLGNPKQIRIHKEPKMYWSPLLAEQISKITTFLVLVKNQDPTANSFFDRSMRKIKVVAPKAEASEKRKETSINLNIANLAKFNYHRRQRKRSFSKYRSKKSDQKREETHSEI